MATNKKSFLLHIDSLDILDDLTNGQAGVLFKAIKAYQNDEPLDLDSVVKIAFSPFKNQFQRDDEKYKTTCERRALAGSKGGKQRVANQAIASKGKQTVANQADSNNKNKTNSKSDNYIPYQLIVDAYHEILPELSGVKLLNDTRKKAIKARWNSKVENINTLDFWNRYFNYVRTSDFLMGTKTDFSASFDFLIKESSMLKTIEGNYDNAK